MSKALVSIIMGSKSDLGIMQEAADILKELAVAYEITIVSAHRTPHRMVDFAENARKKVERCFSRLLQVERMIEIYKSVVQ